MNEFRHSVRGPEKHRICRTLAMGISGAKMPSRANRVAVIVRQLILLSLLSLVWGCGRPPEDKGSSSAELQTLPFDRQPRSSGISPSQSLIPSATKLPEGTLISIRLQSALSSASAHAGDSFYGTVDEPIMLDGQTRVASGTPATGRVLEAKAGASSRASSLESSGGSALEPGYLRIVLVSLNVKGKPVMIETSSIFAKGGLREERNPVTGKASAATSTGRNPEREKDIVFGVNRRLNFRVAQTVDLQP